VIKAYPWVDIGMLVVIDPVPLAGIPVIDVEVVPV
jgi:hypothetical protein